MSEPFGRFVRVVRVGGELYTPLVEHTEMYHEAKRLHEENRRLKERLLEARLTRNDFRARCQRAHEALVGFEEQAAGRTQR
jgi:hypothetical protein